MNTIVVDDDPVSRLALVDLIRRFDFVTAGEFESATMAWEYLHLNPPPMLVCCDIRMPGMTGMEFLRRFKESKKLAGIPFVLVTSASERDLVQEAIRLGACGYIVKPFSPTESFSRLKGFLQSAWSEIAEEPASTMRRLGLSNSKLDLYYTAFRRQIDETSGLLTTRQAGTSLENGLVTRLDSIRTGCMTLGLWHGGRILDALRSHPDPRSAFKLHMAAIAEAVDIQQRWARDGSWRNSSTPDS